MLGSGCAVDAEREFTEPPFQVLGLFGEKRNVAVFGGAGFDEAGELAEVC